MPATNPTPAKPNHQTRSPPTRSPRLQTARPHQPAHRDQSLQTTGLPKPGEANPKVNRQTADQTNSHNVAKAPTQPHRSPNDTANQHQATAPPKLAAARRGIEPHRTASRQPEPAPANRPTTPTRTPRPRRPSRRHTKTRRGTPGRRDPPAATTPANPKPHLRTVRPHQPGRP